MPLNIHDLLSDFTASCGGPELELINEFAKEAAHGFLTSQVDPSDAVAKIAQSHGLTPESIDLLIQETNKAIHQSKFASSEDKYVTFPVADPKRVFAQLEPQQKTASSHPAFERDYEEAPNASFEEGFRKTASANRNNPFEFSTKARVAYVAEKTAHQLNELEGELALTRVNLYQNTVRFMKEARNAVCELPRDDRLQGIFMLKTAMDAAKMSPALEADLLKKLHAVCVQQGVLEKTASVDQYISDEIAKKCQVVRGNHPLYALIQTLNEDYQRAEALQDTYNAVQSKQTRLLKRFRLL